ncbi:MAG: hypothetical protein D3908_11035, partial [Candidatus Electrothrix sp. AUS4]|nr:hypothetical protein [Candidatus Electrothrix sp. AUS4]
CQGILITQEVAEKDIGLGQPARKAAFALFVEGQFDKDGVLIPKYNPPQPDQAHVGIMGGLPSLLKGLGGGALLAVLGFLGKIEVERLLPLGQHLIEFVRGVAVQRDPALQLRDITGIGEASLIAVQTIFDGMIRCWHGVLLNWVEGRISRMMSGYSGRKRRCSAAEPFSPAAE